MSASDGWRASLNSDRRRWVSTDYRFSILQQGPSRYHLVDLDTYNEETAKTLEMAKQAAQRMRSL